MRQLLRIILLAVATVFAGCATKGDGRQEDQVSSIPWNRPANWEGQGAFGSMLQGGR